MNDTWGHPVGDRVLATVSQAIRDAIRNYDHAARIGGEEFAVILPGADRSDARTVIERVRASINSRGVQVGDQAIRVTCSGGLTWWAGPSDTAESLELRADRALYLAKNGGRNQVRELDADASEGLVPAA
jgi:diguanylate cyclase (GGDEF)-like protein